MNKRGILTRAMGIMMALTLLLPATTAFAKAGDAKTPLSGKKGATVSIFQSSIRPPLKVSVKVLGAYTGDYASDLVYRENSYNKLKSGEQWIIYKFSLKYISGKPASIKPTDAIFLYGTTGQLTTKAGKHIVTGHSATLGYDSKTSFYNQGQNDVSVKKGKTATFYYGVPVKKSVGSPLIRFATGYKNGKYSYVYVSTDGVNIKPPAYAKVAAMPATVKLNSAYAVDPQIPGTTGISYSTEYDSQRVLKVKPGKGIIAIGRGTEKLTVTVNYTDSAGAAQTQTLEYEVTVK